MTPPNKAHGFSGQSPLDTYLREINETPLLNAEEEKLLAYRIEDGDNEARDRMIRANLRLVVNIARSYTGKGLGLEDLITEGNLGLLRAVEGYDPSMKSRFSTYASYWIKRSIKSALSKIVLPSLPLDQVVEIYLDPGDASKETIQAVLQALSDLHRAAGGLGLEFRPDGLNVLAIEEATR